MKKRKTILKEAGVLLIAAAMMLSTVAVTANTLNYQAKISSENGLKTSVTSMTGTRGIDWDHFKDIENTNAKNLYSGDTKGDVLFEQLPHDPTDSWSFATSDDGAGYKVYENYWDVDGKIGDVHWWGIALQFTGTGWIAGDPANMAFDISFYEDDGTGHPGAEEAYFADVACSYVGTGQFYSGFEMYYWECEDLGDCVDLSDGLVAIQSQSGQATYGDWILWASAKTGDGYSYQENGNPPETAYDRALQLTGEPMLRFDQVDYYFEECDPCIDSYIGQIKVDIVALTSYYEIPTGFLNVITPMGWVVQNMLISSEFMNEGIPYISTKFGLREGPQCGIDVETLDAYMEFSTTPTPEFYGEDFTTYPVGDTPCYLEGECYDITWPDDIYFPCYPTQICLQFGHPNVQAACNQCAPAAVANSLQWLENMYGINIPHDNVPGIGITGGAVVPPNSLVGQLDHAMRRGVRSRMDGDGVWPMEGKLRYLDETGLYQSIKVKYQGNVDPGKTKVGNVTAKNKGPVTCQCIIDECKEGEDVELVLHYPSCGRHAVELTGAGWICGVQFIQHVSDQQQTHQGDPTDKKGCDSVQTSYIAEIGGKLVVIGGSDPVGTEIEMVYIQSPNDPPKKPSKPSGPTKVNAGTPQTYTTNPATDPDGDAIQQYEWDFDGDGKVDKVTTTPSVTYTWPNQGTYSVRVRARDEYGAVSDWSDPLSVSVPRNKAYTNTAFLNFLQNHPNLFPILRLLIQLLAL